MGEAPQQVQPDEIGALGEAGAEQGAGLGGLMLPQEAERIEVLRPEMARLALEHPIEFLVRLVELLATIQLVGHQEVIDHVDEGRAARRPFRLGRPRGVAQPAQVARPPQVIGPGGRAQPTGLLQVGQGRSQELFLLARLPAGDGLGLGLGEDQQELGAIRPDLGLLPVVEVGVERRRGVVSRPDAVDGQRLEDRVARGLQVGGQVHARVEGAQELGLVAQVAEGLEPGPGRLAVGLDAQLLLDPLQQRLGGFLQGIQPGLGADGRQRLLQVEACAGPVAGGHGDAGAVEQLLALLLHERQPALLERVVLPLLRQALLRECDVQLAPQRDIVPDDEQDHAEDGQGADGQEGHQGLPAFAPLPGAFPGGRGPGLDRVAFDEPAQVVGQRHGAGEPPRRVFLQAFEADRLQVMRDARLELSRRDRLLLDDLADRVDRIARPERRTADQQLVQDGAERVDVGRRADLAVLAPRLLGCHVTGGAEDRAGARLAGIVVHLLGQAEIRDLGHGVPGPVVRGQGGVRIELPAPDHRRLAVHLGQQDVGRLEVAMDDPPIVGHRHGARQGLDELGGRPGTRRALADPLVETASVDQLQREERQAVVLAGLVDLDDIGMRELGDGLGLGAESRQAHGTHVHPGEDHLQGDQALQTPVPGLVDHAHAAAPEFLHDVVTRHGHVP